MNNVGQFGNNSYEDSIKPIEIKELENKDIHVGLYHSIFIEKNKLFSFGFNQYGQLGLEDKEINQISMGGYHTLILLSFLFF